MVDAIGLGAAMTLPATELTGACRGASLADAHRRPPCEGVAHLLVNDDSSLPMAYIGLTIGRELGWDPRRGDVRRGLSQSLVQSARDDPNGDGASQGCSVYRRVNRRIARRATIGEIAWAREWLQANGKTEEDCTRRAREARLRNEAPTPAPIPGAIAATPAAPPALR